MIMNSQRPANDPKPWRIFDWGTLTSTHYETKVEGSKFNPRSKYFLPQVHPINSLLVAFRILVQRKPEQYSAERYLEEVIAWSQRNYAGLDEKEAEHTRKVLTRLSNYMLAQLPEEEAKNIYEMVSSWPKD